MSGQLPVSQFLTFLVQWQILFSGAPFICPFQTVVVVVVVVVVDDELQHFGLDHIFISNSVILWLTLLVL